MKLKIVFFGTPIFVLPVLETLIKHFDVVGVVTTPDVVTGRKKLLTPTPVKIFAQKHQIPVFQPEKLAIGNCPQDLASREILEI
jgi:methionyl-tRNA formyltransferase